MTSQTCLVNELKAHGIRVTPQRAVILRAIEAAADHFTAEEVFTAVQQVNTYINIATVCRTLDLLTELELVTESNMGSGVTQYALRSHGPHHHAVCRTCGRSFEFPRDLLAPAVEHLHREFDFVADDHHIVIFGWCVGCLRQSE